MSWICPPCIERTKSATLSSVSFTNAWSFPTAVTPMMLRCQRSFSPTSAIDTLNLAFTRSIAERMRCRFDLSDPGAGRCKVSLSTPTNMTPTSIRCAHATGRPLT